MQNQINQLNKLKELLDNGIISQNEFEKLKNEIIVTTSDLNYTSSKNLKNKKNLFYLSVFLISAILIATMSYLFIFSKTENGSLANSNNINLTKVAVEDYTILSLLENKWKNKSPELLSEKPTIVGKQAYTLNGKTYVLVVLGFKNSIGCHACAGVNDLALLENVDGNYSPIDYVEDASGGSFGNYGELTDFYLFGGRNLCVGLTSYDGGQGSNYNSVDILGVLENKIKKIAYFYNSEDQTEGDFVKKDISREFRFIKSDKEYYDFELKTIDKVLNNKTTQTIQFDSQTQDYKFSE